GSGGAYTLTLTYRRPNDGEEREPNDRAVDATPLMLGQTVAAYIGHAGDEDWYRIELPEQEPATLDAPTGEPPPAPAPAPTPTEGAAPPAPEGTPPSTEGMPPAEGAVPSGSAGMDNPTGTEGAVAQAPEAPPALPVEPPGVALKLELSSI